MSVKIQCADEDFLERTDKAWSLVLALSGALISAVWIQLFLSYNSRLLAVFLILLGGIVLPLVFEIKGIVTKGARSRCLSWIMVITSMIVTGENYLYHAFWMTTVRPLFVPSVMTNADYAVWFTGFVDAIVIYSGMRYSTNRIVHTFRANLKTKGYRSQLPVHFNLNERNMQAILLFYLGLAAFSTFILFAP